MEYKEFLELLQKRVGKDKRSTERISSCVVKTLKEQCADMNTVSVKGFGNFEPKKKLEREEKMAQKVSNMTRRRFISTSEIYLVGERDEICLPHVPNSIHLHFTIL